MKFDIERIKSEIQNYIPDYDKFLALQGVEGIDDFTYGTDIISKLNHSEKEFVKPNFPQCEYINEILESFGVYHARLMNMPPYSNYQMHHDPTKRWHLPVITSEHCFLVQDDKIHRYPADGSTYIIDTTRWHTFVNASNIHRLHIIASID